MKGLVGVGESSRLINGPAWVSERAVRLSHKAEMKVLKGFMVELIDGFQMLRGTSFK